MLPIDITSVPSKEPQRLEWIKYQLRIRGSSLSQVGRDLGVTRSAPISALRTPYPRMEKRIAEVLGVEPKDLWPERYNADGFPNRPWGRPIRKSISKDSTQSRGSSIQARAGR